MSENWREHESRLLEEVEGRYRARGYETKREVELPGVGRIDLLATRGDETVLVEVRLAGRPDEGPLEAFAEYASRRGWRFNIVLAEGPGTLSELEVPDRTDVQNKLTDAGVLDSGSWLAPIATIAALEAAARYALARETPASLPKPGALGFIQALASRGLVTPDEEDSVRQLLRSRNAAAHGLAGDPAPPGLVAEVLRIGSSLLERTPAAA